MLDQVETSRNQLELQMYNHLHLAMAVGTSSFFSIFY